MSSFTEWVPFFLNCFVPLIIILAYCGVLPKALKMAPHSTNSGRRAAGRALIFCWFFLWIVSITALIVEQNKAAVIAPFVPRNSSKSGETFTERLDLSQQLNNSLSILDGYYDNATGIYRGTGWWNSAECLTTVAQYAIVRPDVRDRVEKIFNHTYAEASSAAVASAQPGDEAFVHILNPKGAFADSSLYGGIHKTTGYSSLADTNGDGIGDARKFLNDFYDDEGWWGLTWLHAFDLTKNETYLVAAADIFEDILNGRTAPCGGVWWDRMHRYENAITNSLFIELAASLANHVKHQPALATSSELRSAIFYSTRALEGYEWFLRFGLINEENLVNDGLTPTCKSNNGTAWTYNQGAFIAALAELHTALPAEKFLTKAHLIANATIAFLTDKHGVLHDVCENDCHPDGTQFKGVFMRGLARLHAKAPRPAYAEFIRANVESILRNNTNGAGEMSVNWAGPYINPANASTQCSAMSALLAAVQLD